MSKLSDLLASNAPDLRFAIVASPYDIAQGVTVGFAASTHGFASLPSDRPASIYFVPRLSGLPVFERSLFSTGKLSGRSASNRTQVVASNSDGELDSLFNYAWAGRAMSIFIGGEGFSFAEYGLVTILGMEEPVFADDSITIPLQDVSLYLDREIQTVRYAGTGGAEGAAELASKLKPDAWGCCRKVPPVYLGLDGNGRHQFGVGSGPIVGVLGVWDRGSPLTYADNPAAPKAGEYLVDVNTGTITLGGAFVGPIQADVLGRRYLSITSTTSVPFGAGAKTFAVPANTTETQFSVGMRVRCLLASDPAGTWMDGMVTARDVGTLAVNADNGRATAPGSTGPWIICPWGTAAGILGAMAEALTLREADGLQDVPARVALNSVQPATCGYWVPQGGNGLQLLDLIAEGSGCFWYVTRANTFRIGRVDPPLGEITGYLDESNIGSIQRLSMDEPSYQYVIKYRRNWSTLSTDQLAGIAAANVFTEEWSTLIATDPSLPRIFLTSKSYEVESIFDLASDAQAEATRQYTLFGIKRSYFRITVERALLTFSLNNVVYVQHSRYGLAAGRLLRIVDLKEDYGAGVVEIGVWG